MADLTVYELQDAILGALEEHEHNTSRAGNASLELQKEINKSVKQIISKLTETEKNRSKENKELARRIETAISNIDAGGSGSSGDTPASNSFFKFLGGKFGKVASAAMNLVSTYGKKIFEGLNKWQGAANYATEAISKTLRTMDSSGINQGYADLQQAIRGSILSLDQVANASKKISQSFAILGKQSGNAAKTFTELSTGASEYSIKNNIAMSSDEIAKYTSEYLDSQRKMGGLDRMNQKQQQDGINALIKNVEEVSKTFGVSREAMANAGTQIDDKLKAQAYATGQSGMVGQLDETLKSLVVAGFDKATIEGIRHAIAGRGSIADANVANAMAEAGTFDAVMSGPLGNVLRSGDFSAINEALKDPAVMATLAQGANQRMAGLGPNAGLVVAASGGNFGGAVDTNAAVAAMGKNAEKKDDSILAGEDEARNKQQQVANEEIALISRSVQNYETYLSTVSTMTEGIYRLLSGMGDVKNWFNSTFPMLGKILGFLGGISTVVSGLKGLGGAIKMIGALFGGKGLGGILRLGGRGLRTAGRVAGRALGTAGRWVGRAARSVGSALGIGGLGGRGLRTAGRVAGRALGTAGRWVGRAARSVGSALGIGGLTAAGSAAADVGADVATRSATKAAEKQAVKTAGKSATKAAGKSILKTGFKSAVKKIPVLGALAGGLFAIPRLLKGDWAGAGLEVASGAASLLPGAGTAASIGIDAALAAKDMKDAMKEEQAKEEAEQPQGVENILEDPNASSEETESNDEQINEMKNQSTLLESLLNSQNTMNQSLQNIINNI